MLMVKLTRIDGDPCWVNMDQVCDVHPRGAPDEGASLYFGDPGCETHVREAPDEVVRRAETRACLSPEERIPPLGPYDLTIYVDAERTTVVAHGTFDRNRAYVDKKGYVPVSLLGKIHAQVERGTLAGETDTLFWVAEKRDE